jgi:hypothetical protein
MGPTPSRARRCGERRTRLAMLARRLPAPTQDPLTELAAVASLLREHLPPGGPGAPVLLPDALRAGRAHDLASLTLDRIAARAEHTPNPSAEPHPSQVPL